MTNITPLVTWQGSYALGMDEIDEQHRMLFEIMNRLWEGIVRNDKQTVMVRVLEALEQYAVQHFTEEEIFMRSFDYPGFDAHIKLHQLFIKKIADEKERVASGEKTSLELLHFLRDWLLNHIMVEDRKYADLHEQRQKGKTVLGRFFKRFVAA